MPTPPASPPLSTLALLMALWASVVPADPCPEVEGFDCQTITFNCPDGRTWQVTWCRVYEDWTQQITVLDCYQGTKQVPATVLCIGRETDTLFNIQVCQVAGDPAPFLPEVTIDPPVLISSTGLALRIADPCDPLVTVPLTEISLPGIWDCSCGCCTNPNPQYFWEASNCWSEMFGGCVRMTPQCEAGYRTASLSGSNCPDECRETVLQGKWISTCVPLSVPIWEWPSPCDCTIPIRSATVLVCTTVCNSDGWQ